MQIKILGKSYLKLDRLFTQRTEFSFYLSLSPSLTPLPVVLHSCPRQVGGAVLRGPHSSGYAGHIPALLTRDEVCPVPLHLS